MSNIYKCNFNYFNRVDTDEKAYILGFLYADGNVSRNGNSYIISYGQVERNKDIVYKITEKLNAENPIYKTDRKGYVFYYVNIHSKQMYEDLVKLGCVPCKSLVLQFPENLPNDIMGAFIRGYFDGDGCVWEGKRKMMRVKDSHCRSGYRFRIIHNVKVTFTGNVHFITKLQEYLISTLGFTKTKLNFSKAKDSNNTTSFQVCTLEYSGRKRLKQLYDFMYNNSTIHGDSKKLKFENIFCALEEKSSKDTLLIAGTPEMAISSQAGVLPEGSSTIPEMGVESSDSKCKAPTDKAEGEDIVSSAIK